MSVGERETERTAGQGSPSLVLESHGVTGSRGRGVRGPDGSVPIIGPCSFSAFNWPIKAADCSLTGSLGQDVFNETEPYIELAPDFRTPPPLIDPSNCAPVMCSKPNPLQSITYR